MKKKNGDYSSTNKQTNQEKHWAKEEGKEEEQHKSQPPFFNCSAFSLFRE
jgi:hypothetical protein